MMRLLRRPPPPPERYGSLEALPPNAMGMILGHLPRESVGALALSSKASHRAVSRTLALLSPVAAALPPPPPREGYVFSNVTCLILTSRWRTVMGNFDASTALSRLAAHVPMLRSCALDLRPALNCAFAGGSCLRPTDWPAGLRSLMLLDAGREDLAELETSTALRSRLRGLTVSSNPQLGEEPWPPRGGTRSGAAHAPPSLVGFTALRALQLNPPPTPLWRVCEDTLSCLTSLRLGRYWLPPPPLPPEGHGVGGAGDADDDGALLLPMRAPAAGLLLTGRVWPKLRHLDVPDDGFCPRSSAQGRPSFFLLFSDAFPNLEALSVALTAPERAPALAASLYGLRKLRRLVLRRAAAPPTPSDDSTGATAEAALAMAEAVYAGTSGGGGDGGGGGGGGSSSGGGGGGANDGSNNPSRTETPRALALGGLAALVRSPAACASLELVVGVTAPSADPQLSPAELPVAPGDDPQLAPHLLASVAAFSGSGFGNVEALGMTSPLAHLRDIVRRGLKGNWALGPAGSAPLAEAGGSSSGEQGGGSATTSGRLAVLTRANGAHDHFIVASPPPGPPIGATSCEERLQAAERALFALCAWPTDSPHHAEAMLAGWRADAAPVAAPELFIAGRAHLLPQALRNRLNNLQINAAQLLAASSPPPSSSGPAGTPPLLCALPSLCKLHVRAGQGGAPAYLVWEVLASGVAPTGGGEGGSNPNNNNNNNNVASSGGGGGGGGGGGSGAASPVRTRSSLASALSEAAEVAAATAAPRPFATSPVLPKLKWLRLEGFPDAGSSPASLRAIACYGSSLRALEIVGAERAPPAAPLVELLSRRFSPSFRYLCIESTVLPAGWIAQVAALLAQPSAHVSSSAWVAHVLAAVPGLPVAAVVIGALSAAAVRQAPRLPEMALTAHLAAVLACFVAAAAALRVWVVAAAEALSQRRLEPPGAALAGRLRLLSLRGCTTEDAPRGGGMGAAAAGSAARAAVASPLVALVRACPRLRYLDLLYYNITALELAHLCGSTVDPAAPKRGDGQGGGAVADPPSSSSSSSCSPALLPAVPPASPSLAYVNTHRAGLITHPIPQAMPLVAFSSFFPAQVMDAEMRWRMEG